MVGTPGHVGQQGLVVSEPLTTPDTGVEVDGATDEVDHLDLETQRGTIIIFTILGLVWSDCSTCW